MPDAVLSDVEGEHAVKRTARTAPVATKRTTVASRTRRSERGDTLVEVLISLVVLGTASVALLIAFSTSIASSGEHRNLATYNTVLATASQEVLAAIDNQPQLFTAACSNNISQYPYYGSAGVTLPAPYNTSKYTGFVQYVNTPTASTTTSLPAVQYWNGSVFQSTCQNNEPQLITIGISGTTYTNSFVVQYPIASTNNNASNPAQKLIFLQQPAGGYAGSPFTTQPIVEISNGSGAVSTDLSPVTLTLTTGTGVLAGCQGNEILGVVTFSGCTIGTGGTGFQITASDGNLTPAVSNPFNVTSSNFYLGFSAQPVAGHSGSPFTTPPSVTVYNSSNNSVDTAWSGTVTLTDSGGLLSNCPGSTTTSDTLTVTNGVATMPSGCDFSGGYFFNQNSNPQVTATQYTMTATATPNPSTNAAVPALSQTFSVTSFGPASQLYFSTEPTGVASASASTAFTGQPAVTVEDAFGNVVTSASNTISLTMFQGSTGETLANCSGSYSEGTDTFSGCNGTAYNTGLHLTAAATGLSSATSTNFNITGVATQLLFTTSPVAGTSGSSFSVQPALVFEDASNRVVTSTTAVVTLTVSPAGGTLSTCTGLAPNLGYVNVANCTFTGVVGTPYTLTASAGGLTSAPSATFSPTSPGVATQLVFSTQPVAAAAGDPMTTQPVVKVEDAAGNVVTSSTASINLTTSGGTLASCTGLTAAAGVVNVSNCTFGGVVATPYTMTASSGTLISATSASFTPSGPGDLSQILLTGCPANITATTSCVITATLEDAFANVETTDNSSVVSFTPLTGIGSLTGFTNATAGSGRATDILLASSAGPTTFDASSASVTSNVYSMTVNAVPTISTTSLGSATQGQNGYNQTVVGTAGTTPYVWSISSGTLPTGLSLNSSTGAITGSVGGSATSQTFTVTLTDADNVTATKSLTITVNVPPSITTSTLAVATQNQTNYSQTLTGAAGTAPYTWSITSGTLPSGLGLNASTGAITGTVSGSATTKTFSVTLTDVNGVSVTKSLTITVNVAPVISPSALPGATITGAYSATLSVTGGTSPFGTWSLTSGTLPSGLGLNTSTGAITGTVSNTATTQTFTVQITDANGVTATKTYTLTVNAAPSITT
ncbi:MAG TPA: putative Ig domain-containing protein, partial [Acidimicrobiales bacterium]|nr:putative Ig domain-containing protein [Acidimicrobiales bacterium]